MAGHDIIVIGASAGGVQAVLDIARDLPADLPAAVFVVVHCSPGARGMLAELLGRAGPLPASSAVDGEAIARGRIYVAPPDHHLLIRPGHLHLSRGPKENNARPAVNPLFRTAALSFGARVVGVILSGNLDDGTAGLLAIAEAGGVTIVQDPDEAQYAGMPESAREYLDAVRVLPLAEIAPLLARLARTPVPEADRPETMQGAAPLGEGLMEWRAGYARSGEAVGLTCPECNGPLWEVQEGSLVQFGCMIGHLYSPETLLASTEVEVEETLGMSLRALEERAVLAERLAARVRERDGDPRRADRHARQADSALERARWIRRLMQHEALPARDQGAA
jgi:two-component system, chemotaxis family, protein-glutamate methylesterase/glutaminase